MKFPFYLAWLTLGAVGPLVGQDAPRTDEELGAIIRAADDRFWTAYNACNLAAFVPLLTRDVEFYHDKSGPLIGRSVMVDRLRTALCGGASKLRRVVVPGTLAVFPLRNGNEIYGAVLSGEHVFYVTLPGRPEFLDGRANFTHLWLKEDGTFRMARILSFHHRPAVETKP